MIVKSYCDLCKKRVGGLDNSYLGEWRFHDRCHNIVLKRLAPLADILFAPQDEWDEYLSEILHIKFRRQADATLGIVKE